MIRLIKSLFGKSFDPISGDSFKLDNESSDDEPSAEPPVTSARVNGLLTHLFMGGSYRIHKQTVQDMVDEINAARSERGEPEIRL